MAMQMATEMIEGPDCKLRMFGVPIDGPTNIFCDNGSVGIRSSTSLESLSFDKEAKHNQICYHRVQEAMATGTVQKVKEGMKTNLSDLFTKILPVWMRQFLLQ